LWLNTTTLPASFAWLWQTRRAIRQRVWPWLCRMVPSGPQPLVSQFGDSWCPNTERLDVAMLQAICCCCCKDLWGVVQLLTLIITKSHLIYTGFSVMGYSVSVAPRWNKLALRRKNLHAKSQHFTDKRTWLDRLGQWCWSRKSILYGWLPVTYFTTNLEYPFTLRVTGIINGHWKRERK